MSAFPQMTTVRQQFGSGPPLDLTAALTRLSKEISHHAEPGARIAVAVGSRGIANLRTIVAGVLDALRSAGAEPFIVPAMGSHGGATPAGQAEILAGYGVSEKDLGTPVRAEMDVTRLGRTDDGYEVLFSRVAAEADGVLLINRIKPHTDFSGTFGSGILKMLVVGLGKRDGAARFHAYSGRHGYERALRSLVRVVLKSIRVLGGVALIEDQRHETARVEFLAPENLERAEENLFLEAKRLMPRLPFQDIDLLIVDQLGKNISGSGMDPNIIGRSVHGYSSFLGDTTRATPAIHRIFVRGLTPETHGNAIGLGMADLTTTRLVRSIDQGVTFINALTALTVQSAKVPIHFDTDREAIGQALATLGLDDPSRARIVRIADTLSLEKMEISDVYLDRLAEMPQLLPLGKAVPMRVDSQGNLLSID